LGAPNYQTMRQVTPDVPGVREDVRRWLERIEETRRVLNAVSLAGVDHASVTGILDVYGKANSACQEARIELPRFERRLRSWLFEPLSAEERAACDEIASNLGRIRDAADSIGERAERLRALAAAALRRKKA
jgi:hypothetical protein